MTASAIGTRPFPSGSSTRKEARLIEGVSQTIVEVEDQDRALKFWTETIDFELTQDEPYEAGRWIEVRTRDKATVLVLRSGLGDRPTAPEELPTSNVFFFCNDLPQHVRGAAG